MIFLSLFAVPLLIAILGYIAFGSRISTKELLLQFVVQAVVVSVICGFIYRKNTTDVEIWNGRVASKTSLHVSCSHSYSCNCRTVSCGENCTMNKCDICHEHSYDINWNVATTNEETVTIDRVDRRGVSEPPRWTQVRIGEPTAQAHSYENYLKAAPDTIFRNQGDTSESMPDYPAKVYDYYRLDRLVQFGASVPDARAWNDGLADINAELGRQRQVNVALVLAQGKGHDWFRRLERRWIGGKKNDAVVVIGFGSDDVIQWCEVMAWTDRAYFKVRLRDEIMTIGKLDRSAILAAIAETVGKDYKRKPMSDFEYLTASATPSRVEFAVGFILSTLIAIGMTWYLTNEDIFFDEDH